ncbi:peptidase S24-like protein [Porphyromonas gingivalis F0185]|uniref:Helix-turn-helix transcriptional regulator n=2 Tax=root TaxID=1 RepID=A0AAF0BF80_PORGN|nr:S24 family peptidase [Porphyromonas gingivalis]ERJ86125.1 peptidase S24-like protein [Porphyromonas gingivalis F0185]WCG02616.1 helix-turn-helix transcriptional regulator [Porphyromonas gingivalis]SJL29186.1 Peptidase S24-like protein [Porphyromonas gingivalis]
MERKIDRFDKFLKHKGINDNQATKLLGFSTGTISKSREKGRDLSDRNAEKALNFFQDLSRVWLLTGVGEMINNPNQPAEAKDNDSTDDVAMVPLLPIAALAGSLSDFAVSVMYSDCEQVVSPIRGADLAITVSGESMTPEYPNGSQIFIKRINEKAFIEWGRVYVLDTVNGSVVKRVFPSDDENRIKCVSTNPEYPPFEINMQDVNGIYRVLLCMSVK